MHPGDGHIHHMRLQPQQAAMAQSKPVAYLLSQLDAQTHVDMLVLAAVLM
jgi:hypothetical protein